MILCRAGALFVLGGLLLGTEVAVLAADWDVPQAPIRFTFRLYDEPSHDEAGYLAHIPDGGILPSPHPRTHVVSEDGTKVESYTLWHGPEAGLWIVFADPGQGRTVDIYVTSSSGLQTWKPATGLRPSPLLVTDASTASLRAAHRLSSMGRVGPRTHVQAKSGIPVAPLSIGGDDTGRPRPTSFYLHAYLSTTDPGKTWVAPFSSEGENEFQIDGEVLVPRKEFGKWGGNGQWLDLDKGLHRVELFSASKNSGAYTNKKFAGHSYLAWKTPTMDDSELGGQPKKPGSAQWAARVIKDREIVRSGDTRLQSASAQNGGPVALLSMKASENFWFEGEDQLAVYTFKALKGGNPDDTIYVWSFEHGARTKGSTVKWLVPGLRENQVTLTAVSGKRKSTCKLPFFAYPTETDTSLESPSDRRDFRYAMQTVLQAYPAQPDPCARWGAAYWNNLMRTAEYGKGYPLLESLLGKRQRAAASKLSPKDLRLLEEIFLDVAPRVDANKALDWVRSFQRTAPTADRRAELKLREAEILLIYLDQSEAAGRILASVARRGGEIGARGLIRLGDLQLQRGELNKATKFYADVQKKVRHQRQGKQRPGERAVASWKLGALKDAAHAKNVTQLVEEGEHLLARQALDRWERNFPLSKISEDFIYQEAGLYMDLGDWKRARWLLEPYCRQVDASSYLPDSAVALLECMERMDEPQETIDETVAFLKDRLEFHPIAERLEDYLGTGGAAPEASATDIIRE